MAWTLVFFVTFYLICTGQVEETNATNSNGQQVDSQAKIQQLEARIKELEAKHQFDQKCQDIQAENSALKKQVEYMQTQQNVCFRELQSYNASAQQCQNTLLTCHRGSIKQQSQLSQCLAIGAKFPKSCESWKQAGYQDSGKYVIDPDGPGPVSQFEVECDMKSAKTALTILHHDSEARIQIDCGALTCYRTVNYQASMTQIRALMKVTDQCLQYVKYECYRTAYPPQWFSFDGIKQNYWGGATPGSGKCACAMTNSCDKTGLVCNCRANDIVWRYDAGLLSDKATLPVSKMEFTDHDDASEDGYHRLGPLQCNG